MKDSAAATFSGLIDLAAAALGGYALGTNDDFFAGMQNLLHPGRGTFITDKYTDRGKWMDGWESRRKRGPGHDWCIIELGAAGRVYGVDIDTNHFLGNHPPFASLDGLHAPHGTPRVTRPATSGVGLRQGAGGLLALGVLAALAFIGWTVAAPAPPVVPTAGGASDDPLVIEAGRGLYTANCAACHGPAGQGTAYGPTLELAGAAWDETRR